MRISDWSSDVCSSDLDAALVSALVPIILLDIYTLLGGDDQDYFRLSREQRFGMTLEQFVADRPGHLARLEKTLAPLRKTLGRSEEHTSELQSLMRISYAVFCLKKNTHRSQLKTNNH